MKHFNIGDRVTIIPNQEKSWTYDWEGQELFIVGINLDKKDFYPAYVDEYNLNYTLAEKFPSNDYRYTGGFYHGDLELQT